MMQIYTSKSTCLLICACTMILFDVHDDNSLFLSPYLTTQAIPQDEEPDPGAGCLGRGASF